MAPIHYRVQVLSTHAHLFAVSLTMAQPGAEPVLSLPVWIPGSYLVREFSQHIQRLRAEQDGQPVTLTQLDKHRWRISGHQPHAALTVHAEVYAFDASVRTAYLDSTRGFFNGSSLCLRVVGQDHAPHQLQVMPPAGHTSWQLATGLTPVAVDERGFGTYSAPSYEMLVDAPMEMGAFWRGQFEVRGVPHTLVVSGAPGSFDAERLLADTQRICEAEVAFWHGPEDAQATPPPFSRYVFMLWATHDGYGGLEHHNSTALICPRADLPRLALAGTDGAAAKPPALKATDGYTSLLGLICHEYFHTWNVKRLRPAEFATYDLERENHTELLWFFEGLTSYYDDLLLLRAGLIDAATYLQLVAKTVNQVNQTPGRLVQTVAQASFDAWTRYYRIQENSPNATVSYYTKGALVGLCLDITLRQHGSSLDHAMRALWQTSGGGPISEADIRRTLAELAGHAMNEMLDAWVHGTTDLPVLDLLKTQGVQVGQEPAPLAQQLGLRVSESPAGITLKNVLRDGLAEQAGMAAGDEWLAAEFEDGEAWRIQKLDDLLPLMGLRSVFTAWVSRDRRMLRLNLQWPSPSPAQQTVVRLTPAAEPASGTAPAPWPATAA